MGLAKMRMRGMGERSYTVVAAPASRFQMQTRDAGVATTGSVRAFAVRLTPVDRLTGEAG